MGYELPREREAKRDFWDTVNGQFQFHVPMMPEQFIKKTRPDKTANLMMQRRASRDTRRDLGR